MWGHAHVESADAIALCIIPLCFARCNMDFIDVIVSCMTP